MTVQHDSDDAASRRPLVRGRDPATARRVARPSPRQLGRCTWVAWDLARTTIRLAGKLDERVWRSVLAGAIVAGLLCHGTDNAPPRLIEAAVAVALAIMAARPRSHSRRGVPHPDAE